ncbi:carboxypeptidase regulatory-like domain-containing protein [Candidatus Wolfebacteria bacterium]|nr:carboxypeptidase regulatory-like domain-containing protein [Candidatus Wolfebacteria bacterium]
MGSKKARTRRRFFVFLVIASTVFWSIQPINTSAFDVRAVITHDPGFIAILFDANVSSTTATTSAINFSSATTSAISVMVDATNTPSVLFVTVSGTVPVGKTLTVSSTLKDTAGNILISAAPTTTLTVIQGLKIAAVRSGTTSNSIDEYVMLYNQTGQAVNVSGTIFLHAVKSGNDVNIPINFATSSIPARGFYLIASASGYSSGISPDATYSTTTDPIATTTTAVYINTTSTRLNASSTATGLIDKLAWGTNQVSTSTAPSSTFAATVATTTLPLNQVLVRKAFGGSTSSTMASGGADSNKGNGFDTRDNATDFVLLNLASQTAIIKNSNSPAEFPFGGGQSDTSAPTVMGSFPGGNVGEVVPTDLNFIGFNFSKPVNPSTVSSSTVSLVVQGGPGTNICSAITLNNTPPMGEPPGKCFLSPGSLTAGTTYNFTIKGVTSTPSVADFSGNELNQPPGSNPNQHGNANGDYQITFSPQSGFSIAPQTPPQFLGAFPSGGSSGVASNITKVFLAFAQAMSTSSFGGVTLTPTAGGSNLLNNASALFTPDAKSVAIPLTTTLATSTGYTLTVPTTVRNSNNVALPMPITLIFTTGGAGDLTGPSVIGKLPNIATGVPVNAIDIHVSTDDPLDVSTVSAASMQVTDGASNVIPGTVSYDPIAREILWLGNNVFQVNTQYNVTLNASGTAPAVQNVSGLNLQDTDGNANSLYQFSFTTANVADTTGPGIMFVNANSFSVAVTFNESVKKTEAENIANYALSSGGTAVTLSALNGHTVTYDAQRRTAIINNISLTAGASFGVTVSNVRDLSNNIIDPTLGNSGGTVQSGTQNGGVVGVGGGFIPPGGGDVPTGFSSSTFGFVPQPEVRPFNSLAGFASNYGVGVPISSQIPASGKILLVFPSAFTVANVTTDSFSPANSDINGPGTGAVTIASVAGNESAKTVTVTLGAVATRNASGDTHDFLRFDLAGIVNPPTPNTTNGYTVDIRTQTGTTTLESMTSRPFFINSAGSGGLTVAVAASGATNGTTSIYLFSPQTGPLASSTTAFASGVATTTFSNLPTGQYNIATDPIINLTGGVFLGQSQPLPVSVSGANSTTSLTLAAAATAASSTVNIFATAAGKRIDVFAGGPQGFVNVPTSTLNGTTSVIIYYPANGTYMVGAGPQINKTFNGPPPAPDYVMPRPVQVQVAGGLAVPATINLVLAAAGQTITGTVTDASSKAIANANVFAFSPQGGFGTFGQSGADGSYRLSVAAGSYKIGANSPGFPPSQETSVLVDSSGNMFVNGAAASSSAATLKLSKPGTKITGNVTDGTSAVQGAQVFAFCDPSVSQNACFGPNGNAGAQTDSAGAYTLYVGNGTWRVGAFIPGYGQQPEVTTVVSGSDVTLADFRPSATGTFNSVSGTVCTRSVGTDCSGTVSSTISGAMVRIEGTDPSGRFFANSAISAGNGTYSFANIPSGAGSSYRVRGFAPTLGELAPTAAFTVTGNVTAKDLVLKPSRTVNISLLNAPSTFEAFMGFKNTTSGFGNFLSFSNNATGTILLPNGSTYSIDARSPAFALGATTIARTAGTATYSTSTGQLDLTSGSDAVTLTVTIPASTVISGLVRDNTTTSISSAWVDVANPTTGLHFGTQANTSGTYSIAVPDGSYVMTAFAPGYVPTPKNLTIASGTFTLGNTTTTSSTVHMAVTKTSLAISGTIRVNSVAAPNALIKGALQGGGTSVVLAGADGTYSLPVSAGTWTVSAVADGYQAANYSSNPVVITASSVSGVDINLTSTVTLTAPTVNPIVPSQGGTVRDSSGRVEIQVPANALGSSANTGQIKSTETSALISTATARPVGTGQDIKAYDSSNNSISTLNDNVSITLNVPSSTFAASSITNTTTAGKLKLGYFDSSVGDWVAIPSTLSSEDANGAPVTPNATLSNVDHIDLTGQSNHFSVFGVITQTDSVAPASPTGVSASVINTTTVQVTWTAPTTNSDGSSLTDLMEFEIYRDTSESGGFTSQRNSSQVASTANSFLDTVVAGTTYYYKVTAADTSGNESAKSSASSAVTPSAGQSVGVGGGGGGGGGGPAPVTTTQTTTATSTPTQTSTSTVATPIQLGAVTPQVVAGAPTGAIPKVAPAGFTFAKQLRQGGQSNDVKYLQQTLTQIPGIYPEGLATGYFGALTRRAVERFQEKYGIANKGDAGYGEIRPKTRAKLNEAASAQVQPPAAPQAPQAPAAPAAPISQAVVDQIETAIKALQVRLTDLLKQLQEALKSGAR